MLPVDLYGTEDLLEQFGFPRIVSTAAKHFIYDS